MSIAGLVKSADWKSEKHVPSIAITGTVKADEFVTVTAQVGREIRHPNTTEHFIAWIEVFYQPEGGTLVSLGRAEFNAHGESAAGANQGPAFADPVFTTRVQLKKSGTLTALAYCNIHGLWEGSTPVNVE